MTQTVLTPPDTGAVISVESSTTYLTLWLTHTVNETKALHNTDQWLIGLI